MLYTYQGIKTEIKSRLSLLSDWNTTLFYGVYDRIIDVIAYTADKLVYLSEFYYKESKWITATKKASVIKMAQWMNYIPYRKKGALGDLSLSASSTFNSMYVYTGRNVPIPKWTRFTNSSNSANIYCYEATTYSTGQIGSVLVSVKEGTPKEFTYIATGIINEIIYIYSISVDNDEIDIYVVDSDNNILYEVTKTDNLYLINNTTDYYCKVSTSSDESYVTIQFGDDIVAKRLSSGERILIKYSETKGALGDVTSSNTITSIKDTLFNEDNEPVILYVNNTAGIIGGSDEEDIESIRNNANNLFQAGMLLASSSNWETVLNAVSYIYKSKAWSIMDVGGSSILTDQNTVFITAVSSTGESLTAAQETDLQDTYIIPKKCLTETITFEPLNKVYLRFEIDARIRNASSTTVSADIKTAIATAYGILYTNFLTNVYESVFYELINTVTGVVYHSTEAYYLEKNINYTVSDVAIAVSYVSTETSDPEQQIYLETNSFSIWIKLKQAGEWDDPLQIGTSSGTAINSIAGTGFTINSGLLDYSTNSYSFVIQEILLNPTAYGVRNPGELDDDGYIIYISYKTKDGNNTQTNNIRLKHFYQITDVDTDFIDIDLITLV